MKAFHPDYREATVSQPGIKNDLKLATLLCHLHPVPSKPPRNQIWDSAHSGESLQSVTRLIVSGDVEEQMFN